VIATGNAEGERSPKADAIEVLDPIAFVDDYVLYLRGLPRHVHTALVLRAPRASVMPVIVLLCAVGAFATGNNLFAVVTVAAFGAIGYVMERNGYPVAAMVLGIVMGTMVEQAFVTSLIKSDGSILPFFSRPVAAVLAAMTIAALLWPLGVWTWGLLRRQLA